jgi:hypothetical protein
MAEELQAVYRCLGARIQIIRETLDIRLPRYPCRGFLWFNTKMDSTIEPPSHLDPLIAEATKHE